MWSNHVVNRRELFYSSFLEAASEAGLRDFRRLRSVPANSRNNHHTCFAGLRITFTGQDASNEGKRLAFFFTDVSKMRLCRSSSG
jgi:hypothetical protein